MMRYALLLLLLGLALPSSSEELSPFPRTLGTNLEAELLRLEDRREFGTALLEPLLSPNAAIRARAALAAGRIGDPAAIEPLAGLMTDLDRSVRSMATFALGEIEDTLVVAPLALLLQGGREVDPEVRAKAIEALAKTGSRDVERQILAGLSDPAQRVREAACLAAWQLQVTTALEPLVAASRSQLVDLRWKATYSLTRMLGAAPSGRTPVPGGIELTKPERALVRGALLARVDDSDTRTRLAALRGLGRFADEKVRVAVRERLTDTDWRVRVQAIRALDDSVDASVLIPLIEDANPNVRLTAIEALGRVGSDEGAERFLRTYLDRASPRELQVAIIAIAERDSSTAPELARRLAQASDWQTRAAAANLLGEEVDRDDEILQRLLHDDPRVAKLAVEPLVSALVREGRPIEEILEEPAPELESLFTAPDPLLRALAIDAVGSQLPDTMNTALTDRWLDLLERQWQRAKIEPGIDVAQTILALLVRHAGSDKSSAILSEATLHPDATVKREAARILAGDEHAGVIETGRSIDEYKTILRWAREDHLVEIVTEHGVIRIRLFSADAPMTCWNFTRLAESGFYDGGNWHRIVPNFVAQDGCPRGDGWGGPGYQIRCEINRHRYETGAVGMALSGKDTGGSQFFITHSPQPHLDGRYTVFGRVTDGQNVADNLAQGDRIESVRLIGH